MNGPGQVFEPDQADLRAQLVALRQEHRELDQRIASEDERASLCRIELQRLKKRTLMLKDRIASLEDRLIPDIIA